MNTQFQPLQHKFFRFLLIGLLLILSALAALLTISWVNSAGEQAMPPAKRGEPSWLYADRLPGFSVATAAETSGELDTIADQVYGQPDYTTGTATVPATDSTLAQPRDIAIYDSGQVFVADTENNRVLGWNCIYSYQNGDYADFVIGQPDLETTTALDPPTAASMNAPTGVAVGFDGFLYVSDTGNNRVLVYFPDNYDEYWDDEEVYYDPDDYFCASGWWFPSEFYAPTFDNGEAADYVLGQPDFESNSILSTNINTLSSPMGLTTDINDNLVVADHGNNRVLIYEWNQEGSIGPNAHWIIGQEQGGIGNAQFTLNAAPNPPTRNSMNGPTDVAAGALGDEVYVADTGNNRVLIFNDNPPDLIADGLIGQPDYTSNTPNNGGLSGSSLNMPMGVTVDAGNRLYVADTGNQRVLVFDQVNPDGVADRVFGQPDFTSSAANNGGISASSLFTPTGLATDIFYADLYIADTGNNRALQYNQPLANPVPAIAVLDPGTIQAGANGFTMGIWGTGIISDTVVAINGITRTIGSDFLGYTQARISASEVITTSQFTVTLSNPEPGGGTSAPVVFSIYEPTAGDDLADSVLGQQGFTTDRGPFAPMTASSLHNPAGVVVDPESGRIFVSDLGNARVLSWPSQQAQMDGAPADLVIGKPDFTTYYYDQPIGRNMEKPAGLALDSQGNLYVADAELGNVYVYAKPFSNGINATLIISELNNPLAVALDSQDNLYVADSFNHRVLVYETPLANQDTTPDRVFGQPDLSSMEPNAGGAISADGLHYPSGVALDSDDNLYVSDSMNHRVLVYLAALEDTTAATAGDTTADVVFGQMGDFTTGEANKGGISAQSLNYPYGLLVDGDGNLYVADSDNHRVLGFVNPLETDTVADMVIGQSGSFARNGVNQGRTTAQGNTAPSQSTLRGPTMVSLNADGDLFVADNGNHRVLTFQGSKIAQVKWEIFLPGVSSD